MIPTQTFSEFPEFANSGTKTAPESAKYSAGFLPADVLPAEWANYFFNGSTKGITALNAGVSSIENEINAVLSDRGITPETNLNNQLLKALQSFKTETLLAAHPVGSLYWTSKDENPAVTFGGGMWKQIKDVFILAAGDTYTNGKTGGSTAVTLTTANLPSHSHSMSHSHDMAHTHSLNGSTGNMSSNSNGKVTLAKTTTYASGSGAYSHGSVISASGCFSGSDKLNGSAAYPNGTHSSGTSYESMSINLAHTHTLPPNTGSASITVTGESSNSDTGNTGNGTAVNIMPPYITRYCWERTA